MAKATTTTTTAPLAVITDKLDYAPGETVTMTITGVTKGGKITYTLADSPTDPGDDGVVTQYGSTTIVDGGAGDDDHVANGVIVTTWTVPTDGSPNNATINLSVTDWGRKLGTVDDRTATTTFTDTGPGPSVTLNQWETLTHQWAGGQTNANQAIYLEGDVVPFSADLGNLTVGTTYSIRINLDYYQSNTDAGGFVGLDTYDKSIAGLPDNFEDPTGLVADSLFSMTGDLRPTDVAFSIGTIGANVTQVSYSLSTNGLTRYADVTFTATSDTAELYWGQTLALPNQVFTFADTTPGTSSGASGFTGGSLQTQIKGEGSAASTWITPSNAVQLSTDIPQQGSISGYKWNDLDHDGSWDSTETAMGGWEITLWKDDGDGIFETTQDTTVVGTVTADGTGSYSFSPIVRGTYFVVETQQDGWIQSYPSSGTPITINEYTYKYTDINFGNYRATGSISWEKRDEGGAPLGGATFTITNDAGVFIKVVDNDANDTDQALGVITVNNIALGTYTVTETVAPTGYAIDDDPTRVVTVSSTDLNAVIGTQGTNDAGDEDEDDFHNFKLIDISGTKYLDNDADGVLIDDGDQPLSSNDQAFTIKLYSFVDIEGPGYTGERLTERATTETDINGNYAFTGLGPLGLDEKYYVLEDAQAAKDAGWYQSYGTAGYVITPTSGVNNTGNNFGNYELASVDGTKFKDLDRDGCYDDNEPGWAGVTITLTREADDDFVAVTKTDANGYFLFQGLAPGKYTVTETLPAGSVNILPVTTTFTLTSGEAKELGNVFANAEIPAPKIYLDKYVASVGSVDFAGDVVTYGFTVTNTGNIALTNVNLADYFENNIVPVSPTLTSNGNGNSILDVGETWTYTLDHTVTQPELDAARKIVTETYEEGFFLCEVNKCTGDLDLDNYAKVTANVVYPTGSYSTSTAPTTTVTASDFASVAVTCPTDCTDAHTSSYGGSTAEQLWNAYKLAA